MLIGQQVRIVELVGQHYRLIKTHHIDRAVESLKTELSMVLCDGTFPESEEQILIDHALSNLSSNVIVSNLQSDIRIYMEALIAHVKWRAISKGPENMVITDDHTFFKVFASNPTAETILLNQVEMALKLDSVQAGEIPRQHAVRLPIHIKLAGDLVPGM